MFDRVGDGQVMVKFWSWEGTESDGMVINTKSYQIIVADAADAVSVNFSGRCKFLQI